MNKIHHNSIDQYSILIVDDDEEFRIAHRRLMTMIHLADIDASFKISEADNKEEALKIVKEEPIDCVMLDYKMPDGNGLEYMKQMLLINPDLTVIMVTGAGNEEIAVKAMKAGAMDYLVKGSISLESLERAIVNAINRSHMLRTIEEQKKELLEAERYRVMMQSIGSACHHLGQPATVLRTCIVTLRRQEHSPEMEEMLKESFIAVENICNVLFKLRHVSLYQTEEYLPNSPEDEILKL